MTVKIETLEDGTIIYNAYEKGVLVNRTSYIPTVALSQLPKEVKAEAEKLWTDAIKSAYIAKLNQPLG